MVTNQIAVLLLAGVIVTGIIVSIYDYRQHRIPNFLLAASMIFALSVWIYFCSIAGFEVAGRALRMPLLGLIISGFIMMVPYKLNQIAAGDVKLAMVFGFYLGPIGNFLAMLNAGILGGIWALWISWKQGGLSKVFGNMKTMAISAYVTAFKDLQWDLNSDGAIVMPYGVVLSIGAILVAIWQLSYQVAF
ncbi:MAG: A24 family peptidase [Thiotrichales bacterium]|nr:A24 family peptidase [Thiotrichales bacterium]